MLLGGLIFGSVSAYAGYSTINVSIGGIKLFIGGEQKYPESQPLIYSGRTYVSLRFIAEALGETVEWDAKTSSVYIGGRQQGSFLTDVLKPVSSDNADINEKVEVGSDVYFKTISGLYDTVTFDLKGKFKRLTLKAISNYTTKIYADDELIWEHDFEEGDLPIDLDLDMTGVNKLQFDNSDGEYAILNPKVYP